MTAVSKRVGGGRGLQKYREREKQNVVFIECYQMPNDNNYGGSATVLSGKRSFGVSCKDDILSFSKNPMIQYINIIFVVRTGKYERYERGTFF